MKSTTRAVRIPGTVSSTGMLVRRGWCWRWCRGPLGQKGDRLAFFVCEVCLLGLPLHCLPLDIVHCRLLNVLLCRLLDVLLCRLLPCLLMDDVDAEEDDD